MLLERFTTPGLAHYSYLVACEESGVAAVVDPRRDVDEYVRFAADRGLDIRLVLETHIHADYASGALELATLTGAELALSAYDEGEQYDVGFPHRELRDGETLELGSVRIEVLHTPGHTPEHLSFLVSDRAEDPDRRALLSGDFLFVGSLGRPDLLGEGEAAALAGRLFRSVREKLAPLPDDVEVHPAHGAGSLCGAGMSGRAESTLGFERISNPYLNPDLGKDAFIDRILATAPPFPAYYLRMKRLNADGPPPATELLERRRLDCSEAHRLVEEKGAVVVDVRDQLEFGVGHVRGAFGIGYGPGLSTWAPWVVPYDRPLVLQPATPGGADGAIRALLRVGLDRIEGWFQGTPAECSDAGFEIQKLPQIGPQELADEVAAGEVTLIDVRSEKEWAMGHAEGATHIPVHAIVDRLDELGPTDTSLAIQCGSGYRSTIVASLLQQRGYDFVVNASGGMQAWAKSGQATITD